MRQATLNGFWVLTPKFEGVCHFMYLDILGLVTTAIGNLIDSPGAAALLPWKWKDGREATFKEKVNEWNMVKSLKGKKTPDGRLYTDLGGGAFQNFTQLRLTDEDARKVVNDKLDYFEKELTKRFPQFPTWCADAQLATLSMAWACGEHFNFPDLASALLAEDWMAASKACHINTDGADRIPGTADDNRGVIPRNKANKSMYRNAYAVAASGLTDSTLDADTLYWPRDLVPGPLDFDDTEDLQKALIALGFSPGRVDGQRGPKTIQAIKDYQTERGLVPDGVIGPKTKVRLAADMAAHEATV